MFVTYDQDEATELVDLVIVMSMGRIKQIGKPRDIRHQTATPFVRKFEPRSQGRGGTLWATLRQRAWICFRNLRLAQTFLSKPTER